MGRLGGVNDGAMNRGLVLTLKEARRRKAGNRHARWRTIADQFAAEVWPDISPTFKVNSGDTVFTIGSCFARNIENHLASLGCRVPMMGFQLPASEWDGPPRSAMNRYHPPAFRQCLEWTATIHDRDGQVTWDDCEPMALEVGDGRLFDLDMAATQPVSRERFLARRTHIYEVFSTVFTAECLMMTPGLTEAWRDRTTGLYLYDAPHLKAMLALPDRWEFEILSYEQCFQDLAASIDLVRARNPQVKILITTSPVPLAVTFSGRDIRTANAYSKSVLRACCDAVAMQRPLVDYFPSYESVTQSFPAGVWKADRQHVSQGFIGKIVTHMLDHYLDGVDAAARSHQRAVTLLWSLGFAEAEAAARDALAVRPDHAEARAVLTEALLQQGRWAEAEAEVGPLSAGDPERADLRVKLARAVGRNGDGDMVRAVELLDQAALLSSFTLADFRSAEALLRRAPPEAAERLARRAVELFPLHVEAYPALVEALQRQGRKADALVALQRVTALSKPPAEMHAQLARLLADAGRTEEASAAARAALAYEPANRTATRVMAELNAANAPVMTAPAG